MIPSMGSVQTVWLEPVPAAHITRVDLIPDVDISSVDVTVHGSEPAEGLTIKVPDFIHCFNIPSLFRPSLLYKALI